MAEGPPPIPRWFPSLWAISGFGVIIVVVALALSHSEGGPQRASGSTAAPVRNSAESAQNAGKARTRLVGIDLRAQTLTGFAAPKAALIGAVLTDARLRHADLAGAWIIDGCLRNIDLTGADLRDAHLVAVDLRGADLSGATLAGASLVAVVSDASTTWPDGREPRQAVPLPRTRTPCR